MSEVLSVRISEADLLRLRTRAASLGVSLSELVRAAALREASGVAPATVPTVTSAARCGCLDTRTVLCS